MMLLFLMYLSLLLFLFWFVSRHNYDNFQDSQSFFSNITFIYFLKLLLLFDFSYLQHPRADILIEFYNFIEDRWYKPTIVPFFIIGFSFIFYFFRNEVFKNYLINFFLAELFLFWYFSLSPLLYSYMYLEIGLIPAYILIIYWEEPVATQLKLLYLFVPVLFIGSFYNYSFTEFIHANLDDPSNSVFQLCFILTTLVKIPIFLKHNSLPRLHSLIYLCNLFGIFNLYIIFFCCFR